MYRSLTTRQGWRILREITADCDVVQIGFSYGTDTAYLATDAKTVTSIGQAPELAHEGYRSALDQWHAILIHSGARSKVFHHAGDWSAMYDRLIPGGYDVAVIDAGALPGANLAGVIGLAFYCSNHVAVLGLGPDHGATLGGLLDPKTHQVNYQDSVHVISPRVIPVMEAQGV